jgi:hypothetical protein
MKKNLIISTIYLAVGLAFGVFYREFTKWNNFVGVTTLGVGHAHLIALGMLLFLILTVTLKNDSILQTWKYKAFLVVYNIGLGGTALMMLVRGILQVEAVKGMTLSSGIDGMVSGVAGLFHLTLAAGLVFLFMALYQMAKKENETKGKVN